MSSGKASDFKVFDETKKGGLMAKRPLDSSTIALSSSTIADDASIGDVLGTLSITGATVGTPRWEIIGQANFAVNALTGVVSVAQALTAGADSFKVKVRGTTPGITSPTFAITVTAAGGDETPEWVPANAKIYIDLVNDRAWTEADGEVAINTLLGADANTVNGWDTTSYDAGNLTADGYPGSAAGGSDVAYINAALSSILSGATIVVKSKVLDANVGLSTSPLVILSADGNHGVEFDLGSRTSVETYDGPADVRQEIPGNFGVVGAINVSAMTYAVTRADIASNGQAAITTELTGPEITDLVAAVCSVNASALQSITIYDALPSTAGLSALSETGVTNTAPTGITIPWADFGAFGADGNYSATLTVPNTLAFGLTGADPEGNPCVISLIADESGQLSVANASISVDVMPAIGAYDFTLRATDPGGLYVEQEFTITVTA